MRRWMTFAALCTLAAACATPPDQPPGRPDPAAERGLRFAQRACAGCHNLNDGESPRSGAPSFAQMHLRYNSVAMERRMATISQHGHYEMPPVFISTDEAKDVAAYVQSLGRP